MASLRTMSSNSSDLPFAPRIVIVGAAYGGLSVAINLLNLCNGGSQFESPIPVRAVKAPTVSPRITILDERDGICTL
jgi:hypothetical protein